jgi:spore germination cell wall hydrolase CwlJ-like protein
VSFPGSQELAVVAQTVLLEAASEPPNGKLAVAFVITNRMKKRAQTAFEVCWAKWQFSCWLDPLPTIAWKFKQESEKTWSECVLYSELALKGGSVVDPSGGATHYLNKELTIQQTGKLPGWVENLTHTVKIGAHDFYKE